MPPQDSTSLGAALEPAAHIFSWPVGIDTARVVCALAVPGDPATKLRPRFAGGRAYTPAASRTAEQLLAWAVKMTYPDLVRNDSHGLGVRVLFFTRTRQRRDIDNLVKLVLDACTGVVWRDDMQVEELSARLQRGVEAPRTELLVYTIGEPRRGVCEQCGATWAGPRAARKRFCSKRCYDEAQRRGAYRSCFTCGQRVYCQNDRLAQSKRFFCSPACKSTANTGQLICRQCQRPFSVYRSVVLRRAFCSPACAESFHRARTTALAREHRYRVPCPVCGGPMSRKGAARCRACFMGGHALLEVRNVG